MQPSPSQVTEARPLPTLRFGVIERQPLRPVAILLAVLAAVTISAVLFGLSRNRATHSSEASSRNSSSSSSPRAAEEEEKDDPNQVDTIVLGDPTDAPVPARRGDHVSAVHATILVHLPRYGDQVGLIPDSPAGHLLYAWLAAFNQASYPALKQALPNTAPASTAAAQMQLRRYTGGFKLLSAKQVQPGVLVFRLRDQTAAANEVLGTLQMRMESDPAAIDSFSLRAVLPTSGVSKATFD